MKGDTYMPALPLLAYDCQDESTAAIQNKIGEHDAISKRKASSMTTLAFGD